MPFHIASSPSAVNFEAIAIELENQNKELKRQLESVIQINKRMQLFKTEDKPSFDIKSIPCFRCDGAILGVQVCQRCQGTGKVDPNYEGFILNLIDYYISKKLLVNDEN